MSDTAPLSSASSGDGRASEREADNARSSRSSVASGSRRNAREEAEKLPLVQRALDVLGAALQRVDEGFGVLPNVPTNPG